MFPREKLRQADVVTSVVLLALGTSVILGALRMPLSGTYGGLPITWYTSPAFFPLLLGLLLILCSTGVLIRALSAGGGQRLVSNMKRGLYFLPQNKVARRILAVWAVLLGYILCLALHPFAGLSSLLEPLGDSSWTTFLIEPEGTNYVLSSFLFLALFMFLFYRPRNRGWTWKESLLVLGMCLLAAWSVGYVFTQHLYSPLPW